LASQGLMPLEAGIALILGANVGTVGTAMLSSIGKPAEAVQVGVVHLLFNCFGVLFFVFIIPQFADFVRFISPSSPELEGVARLAAETPRQVANAHTTFSVVSTMVLIWFVGPIARLAQFIVPSAPREKELPGDPVYLDDVSLTVPSLGIQRVRLELARLGEQVLGLVRRGAVVANSGSVDDIAALLDQDKQADRLASAILHYIGRLSQVDHSEEEARQMVDLTQVVTGLDGIADVATTNLTSVSQQRLAEGIDLSQSRDENTSRFVNAVFQNLEQAIEIVTHPNAGEVEQVIAAKADIEALAAAARHSVLDKLRLDDASDVRKFRLISEMLEHGKEVARFARMIAKAAQNA